MCDTGNLVRCADSWKNYEVKAQCEAYNDRVCSGCNTYPIQHCVLCNHIEVPEPCHNCIPVVGYDEFESKAISVPLYCRRLKRRACALSEMYDPLYRVCRTVFMWEFKQRKDVLSSVCTEVLTVWLCMSSGGEKSVIKIFCVKIRHVMSCPVHFIRNSYFQLLSNCSSHI
jgi:hypothetical protein